MQSIKGLRRWELSCWGWATGLRHSSRRSMEMTRIVAKKSAKIQIAGILTVNLDKMRGEDIQKDLLIDICYLYQAVATNLPAGTTAQQEGEEGLPTVTTWTPRVRRSLTDLEDMATTVAVNTQICFAIKRNRNLVSHPCQLAKKSSKDSMFKNISKRSHFTRKKLWGPQFRSTTLKRKSRRWWVTRIGTSSLNVALRNALHVNLLVNHLHDNHQCIVQEPPKRKLR